MAVIMQNANYIFNVEYLKYAIDICDTLKDDESVDNSIYLEKLNFAISKGIKIRQTKSILPKNFGIRTFKMKTTYPGVLIGTGNSHSAGAKGEMELGFTFDYVTGVPYLPGSSLKGLYPPNLHLYYKHNRDLFRFRHSQP